LVGYYEKGVLNNFEQLFFEVVGGNKTYSNTIQHSILRNIISIESLDKPTDLMVKNCIEISNSKNSPLTFQNNHKLNNSQIVWENSINSLDIFKKEVLNDALLEDQRVISFFKNQVNLNKFFIEKSLYMFSGVDWVYYYYLPKTYQNLIYQYSLFIRWVISSTGDHNFSLNKKQIDNLTTINQLSEITLNKVNKKL